MKKLSFFTLVFALLIWQTSCANTADFKQIQLTINDIDLTLEYADTKKLRNRGLMYRKMLCEQCGMLFKFDKEKHVSMWMKNTYLPLDVAFIQQNGIITDIKPMTPHDLTSVTASKNVLYALEMNQGWFNKHEINVGDKIDISIFVDK